MTPHRNRIRAILALALTLALLPIAAAQVDEDAAELLRCAAERHSAPGGTLVSSRDLGSITYFGPGGAAVAMLDAETILDYQGLRFRGTFSIGSDIVLIQQLVGDAGFTYSPATGTLPLPPSEREALRQVFVTGIAGIFLGDARDAAEILPDVTLPDLEATAIATVTEGVAHLIFLADDCTLVAEVTLSPQLGELLTYYLDYRDVDGWWVPFLGEGYLGDELFARAESFRVSINEPLADDLFEAP